jgi:predicted Rossmann-fold nucleotide-binding protein
MPSRDGLQFNSDVICRVEVRVGIMPSVGVFCGCRPGVHEDYTAAAVALGMQLANRKITLIYGGGTVGLMGSVNSNVESHSPE